MANIVYVGASLDGYIADKDGGLDWLQSVPNPDHNDFGWSEFMGRIDAIVMGRVTFETVCSFDCPWPYTKPVFVVSNTLTEIPPEYSGKVQLLSGLSPRDIVEEVNAMGYHELYIDGGGVIKSFLKEDLADELIVTTIPVLLGGGTPLFGDLPHLLMFDHVKTEIYLESIVQSHYRRR